MTAESLGDVLATSDDRKAGATDKVRLTLKIRRYNPELRGDESWWDEFTVEAEPQRPAPRRAAHGEVAPRRHARAPPLLRARHLRFGRHADQRSERPGLQGSRERPRSQGHGRADPRPTRPQGPDRRHGAVLRRLPVDPAVPRERRRRPRQGTSTSRRRTVTSTTTRRSASSALAAPLRARSSGATRNTSAPRRSSPRTGSSTTRATRPRRNA